LADSHHLGGRPGKVLGEEAVEVGRVDIGVGVAAGRAAEGSDHEVVGDLGVASAERVCGRDALAFVEGVRGDVDQGLDVGVAGGGLGDDCAAVGVADQDDRPVDGGQELA
jgi:hypothetical protein